MTLDIPVATSAVPWTRLTTYTSGWMNNTIGIATPLNSEEGMTMDPILFSLRYLDSRSLSLWLAQARRNGAHRAMKNQLIIDTPPGTVRKCRRGGDCGRGGLRLPAPPCAFHRVRTETNK